MIIRFGNKKLVSIASATGWKAAFVSATNENAYILAPLVCWAILQDETGQANIFGVQPFDEMAGEMGIVEDDDRFLGYFYEDEEVDDEEMKLRIQISKEVKEEMENEEESE